MLKDSIKTGISFGLTSAIITTLGLMVGLDSSTHSKALVLGGILMIAVADALSDSLGIHISEESAPHTDARHVWTATLATFLAKLLVAASFALPFFFAELQAATLVALGWGALLLIALSWRLAQLQSEPPLPMIVEHLLVGTLVVALSHGVGLWVAPAF